MAKTTEVLFEGQMVPAEQLDFKIETEPWTVYTLEDGTVLKFKNVLSGVMRLIGKYKPDGDA